MTGLSLHGFHQQRDACFTEINGMEVVEHFGDPMAEYAALCESAGILDLSFRGRVCVTGADRMRFLHGQVTNNVKELAVGQGCYAALTTARGKMQSDLNIYCLPDELLLDFEPGYTATVSQRLEKYIIADDAQVVEVGPQYGLLSLQGPKAGSNLTEAGLAVELPAQTFSLIRAAVPAWGEIYCMNQPRTPAGGFDLFVPTPKLSAAITSLITAANNLGGRLCGWQALETVRIEAGIPRFGVDMDETNLPPEAGIETRAISYTKGCYIGQEVIARIRTYGQVSKTLNTLLLAGGLKTLPQKGDKLFCGEKEAGYITSAVASPALKANIALGYVRREFDEPGAELTLRSAAGETLAKIAPRPIAL